jgi:hypothetical protein
LGRFKVCRNGRLHITTSFGKALERKEIACVEIGVGGNSIGLEVIQFSTPISSNEDSL